ncbi:MAG: 1-acyl-sn-glycerol-3-phosphate acyltransferase [Clostridia bacterium]|nr:1-acyl-sn-glycerol-3-phosphate acyltransferase [Clostridia bacterium]
MFIPKIKYIYPKQTDEQIIKVEKKRDVVLDNKYYRSLKKTTFKIGQFFFKILFVFIAHPLVRIRYHLKVKGRKEFKKHRKTLRKNGFITVSNHVFMWDYVALCASMRMGLPNVPAWGKIVTSKFGKIFSLAGVIPIPEERSAFMKFMRFVEDVFKENKWVHIYPETGLWYYYVPIRPFKRGAAVFAYKYNKPIVPVGYSYRERKGLSKLIFKTAPFVTTHIGEPIYPDMTLNKREAVEKLNNEVRNKIIEMVGIGTEENNQRIMEEYYKYEDGHFYTTI